jgi:hypothetical protein
LVGKANKHSLNIFVSNGVLDLKSNRKIYVLNSRTVRVERLVSVPLKSSGQAGSKGGFRCFWCPNKTSTLSIDSSGTLENRQKWIIIGKVMGPQSRQVKNSKKQTSNASKPVPEQQNIPRTLLCCY